MTVRRSTILFLLGGLLLAGGVWAATSTPGIDWWVFGSGGAPSSGGTVEMDDTLGQAVIGPSSGGAVALHLDLGATGLVLIAPAWRKWAAPATVARSTVILHSPNDDVIPVGDSRELLKRSGLPEHHLVVAGEDHKMTDDAAFAALLEAIERFGSP